MGAPKPLLALGQSTFLERGVHALREGGCDAVLAVIRADADAVAAEAVRLGVRIVRNPAPEAEQIDSVRIALAALPPQTDAAVILPADIPEVRPETVRAVIRAFWETGTPIVLPGHQERHGHPPLFAREVWPELLHGTLPEGARTVIHADPGRVRVVDTGDPRILRDIDTPAELIQLRRGAHE